jgi:hypothetical protein
MAQVSCDMPSSFRGYRWHHAGDAVEMPDEEAAELLAIAGPHGGYAIAPKRAARKAVTEPAPKGAEFSEVTPEAGVAEAAPKGKTAPPAAPAAKPAAK